MKYIRRAMKGAEYLDKKLGTKSWRKKIDKDRLDLLLPCDCILGQLYLDYYEGTRNLGITDYGRTAQRMGFCFEWDPGKGQDHRYQELTEAWKEVLK